MKAVHMMQKCNLSLNKSLAYAGISKAKWYWTRRPRNPGVDAKVVSIVQKIGTARPTYGTRRMAASVSTEAKMPVNRKKIQRIFRKLGWVEPAKKKRDIIRPKRQKPTRPNQLWQADMTQIHAGRDGWAYLFNIIDVFTREWAGYAFAPNAKSEWAVTALTEALASVRPDCKGLAVRTDNGSQYVSEKFRKTTRAYGIRQVFIHYHTLEQNGHIESFHKSLKKEYL